MPASDLNDALIQAQLRASQPQLYQPGQDAGNDDLTSRVIAANRNPEYQGDSAPAAPVQCDDCAAKARANGNSKGSPGGPDMAHDKVSGLEPDQQ